MAPFNQHTFLIFNRSADILVGFLHKVSPASFTTMRIARKRDTHRILIQNECYIHHFRSAVELPISDLLHGQNLVVAYRQWSRARGSNLRHCNWWVTHIDFLDCLSVSPFCCLRNFTSALLR